MTLSQHLPAPLLWRSAGREPPWGLHAPWLPAAYSVFAAKVSDLDPPYPCHFGVHGQRDGRNWFTAIDSAAGGEATVAALASAVRAFQPLAWRGPKRQSLIAFIGPPDPRPDFARDSQRFWALLSGLAAADEQPWPPGYPEDVRDPRWQWCFAGEPWFVFGCSPAYQMRRSRNLGPCLTLVFQVRRVFEGLSGSSDAGKAAKRQVRSRLLRYDALPPHPHLGDDQHSSVFKWRQYMLPDDECILSSADCPFQRLGSGEAWTPAGPVPKRY